MQIFTQWGFINNSRRRRESRNMECEHCRKNSVRQSPVLLWTSIYLFIYLFTRFQFTSYFKIFNVISAPFRQFSLDFSTLEGHLDSITSSCFSPDGTIATTVSCNADFRVWSMTDYKCLNVKEDAHDYGIQSCDMSQNMEPIPNVVVDAQSYLLATCGNDSLVKLWRITVPKVSKHTVRIIWKTTHFYLCSTYFYS